MNNKAYSMFGLAMRAGKLVSGEFATEKAIKDRSARLVITAADASDNTRKQFQNSCTFYRIPYYAYGTKAELGHAIGKEYRASLAVTDEGFAKSIIKMLEEI